MKKLFLTLLPILLSGISCLALSPIVGAPVICYRSGIGGSTAILKDSTPGGTWSSSNPLVARVDSANVYMAQSYGYLTGIAPGTATITYTLGSAIETLNVTVGEIYSTITGPSPMCIGDTAVLSSSSTGGTWMGNNNAVAEVGVLSGQVIAHANGIVHITYLQTGYCIPTFTLTVGPGVDSILGSATVCTGSTTPYSDPVSGGIWSSSDPTVATISSGGLVTGISAGTAMISYSITSSCGLTHATKIITVGAAVTPAAIAYTATTVLVGATLSFTNPTPGGTWSSSNTAIATINPTTGLATGVAPGTAILSYTVCGGAPVTQAINVNSLNGISGHVYLATGVYTAIKVWLIKYNPATSILTAVDSVVAMPAGTGAIYYQFTGLPTDSFRIKAALDVIYPTSYSGFMPTYHSRSLYWNTANVINHISGASDINKDITLDRGIVSAGPGFVEGDVTTGANKGTASSSPAIGLRVFLLNATYQIVQMTQTDLTGHYAFTNLPVGQTYSVFPEELSYATTPFAGITLTSSASGMTAAHFEQRTISKKIVPFAQSVNPALSTDAIVTALPNPTTGNLNIIWKNANCGKGIAVITDLTGRELQRKEINLTNNGDDNIDLTALNNGLFLLYIKTANYQYNTMVQVQH